MLHLQFRDCTQSSLVDFAIAVRSIFYLTCVLWGLSCSGCGSTNQVLVSGRITLDGEPLAGVAVTFQPLRTEASEPIASDLGSTGVTDEAGRYTLRSMTTGAPGAAIGEHKVYIGPTGRAANDVVPVSNREFPAACTDGSLIFKVPQNGTAAANFDLKFKGG